MMNFGQLVKLVLDLTLSGGVTQTQDFIMIFNGDSLGGTKYKFEIAKFIHIIIMTDIQQIKVLALNILQPSDNELRSQSEQTLVQLRDNQPNELVTSFLYLLQGQQSVQVRTFAATQIRKNLSSFAQSSFKNVWSVLTPQTQTYLKTKLFEILMKEATSSVRHLIADAIGEIAGSVLNAQPNDWIGFKEAVWACFQINTNQSIESAFRILETFFGYAPQVFSGNEKELYALFKSGFTHVDNPVKVASMKAFSSYLSVLENKKMSVFEDLSIPLYQATYYLLINDKQNDQGLEVLTDIVDTEPKFFKKSFNQLNELMYNIVMLKDLEDGVKRMATELLISFAERYPAHYRQSKQKLGLLIEMIFMRMIDIDTDITDQWKKPEEGYNEEMQEDDDYQTTRFGMTSVDRLISAIGDKEILPILSATVQKMLAMEDWRYKYAAIMAISQVGEYIEEAENIKSIVEVLCNMMADQNPMLRYACCHAFGQISDDMQPNFQKLYSGQVFPRLMNALQDPVPRVISHSAAALTNFLEGMQFEQVQDNLDKLIQLLLFHINTSISLVKESAMSALASAAELAGQKFLKYYQVTIPILFDVLNKQQHQAKEYRQLKGQTIETLTLIASAVGKDIFRPVATKLIEYLIALQSSKLEQVDPQKTYVLTGWQRLCIVFGQDLGSSLSQILPSLFQLVTNVLETNLKNNKLEELVKIEDVEGKDENINTFETEQAEVAISMLNVFIQKLKHHYIPYVEATVKLLCPIIKEHPNEDIKKQACKCLPSLIASLKSSNSAQAAEMAKLFIETLIDTAEKEFDTQMIIDQMESLKDVISELDLRFLNSEELSTLSQRIIKLLVGSDERKNDNKKIKQQEELEPEENELIDDEIKLEEEMQVAISQLIGALFKTHKQMTVGLVEYIINNVLPKVFLDNLSDNMHKFGIFLIDDMVEFLGFELLSQRWNDFAIALMKYSVDKNVVVRQAACYGLGIYAERTPPDAFKGVLENALTVLFESSKIPKGPEKEKAYGHCRDNAIASIGKIIKAHGASFDPKPILKLWLGLLPLKFDKPEAQIQHQLLADIIFNSPQLLVTDNEEGKVTMVKILSVFGDIIDTKVCTQPIKNRIKEGLIKLKETAFFVSNFNFFWTQLSENERKKLTELMK